MPHQSDAASPRRSAVFLTACILILLAAGCTAPPASHGEATTSEVESRVVFPTSPEDYVNSSPNDAQELLHLAEHQVMAARRWQAGGREGAPSRQEAIDGVVEAMLAGDVDRLEQLVITPGATVELAREIFKTVLTQEAFAAVMAERFDKGPHEFRGLFKRADDLSTFRSLEEIRPAKPVELRAYAFWWTCIPIQGRWFVVLHGPRPLSTTNPFSQDAYDRPYTDETFWLAYLPGVRAILQDAMQPDSFEGDDVDSQGVREMIGRDTSAWAYYTHTMLALPSYEVALEAAREFLDQSSNTPAR